MTPKSTRRLLARIRRRLEKTGADVELAQLERLSDAEVDLIVAQEAGCDA